MCFTFAEGELQKAAVVAKFATTAADGKVYQVEYYNLDVIISVGYRVKSLRGTKFRQWATGVLREHLLRGYTIKQGVSMEQFQQLAGEINEKLRQTNSIMFEEFGRVYEIISEITEQKRLQESTPRRKIGYPLPYENNNQNP